MPSVSEAAAKFRVVVRFCSVRCPSSAINTPIAQAETKHTTSPYENTLCQFQRIESVVLVIAVEQKGCRPIPTWTVVDRARQLNPRLQRRPLTETRSIHSAEVVMPATITQAPHKLRRVRRYGNQVPWPIVATPPLSGTARIAIIQDCPR